MKSKAHYKKCVELGVVPVPTTVCDENIDKEAIARLAAGGGNAEESSEEEEESDGEESEESGSEEQEAAQSLLSLSQHNTMNRLPGLLPSGRPTTYPYVLTLSTTTSTVNVVSTAISTSVISSQSVTQGAAMIQNELSHRYYFPSNRNTTEEPRISVIQSSKKDDSDFEIEEITDGVTESRHQPSQPMDLTTKQVTQLLPSPIPQRARPADILTPVSEPVLLQTIVQTMERLPIQGREWKPDAEGHMLQAYLTERHVMDSKMKQQYRVGSTKLDKQMQERDIYPHQESNRSRHIDSNSILTVTYTDAGKMQQMLAESRVKQATKHTSDDIKMEIREKIYQNNMAIERRALDYEAIHKDKEQSNRTLPDHENYEMGLSNAPIATKPNIEYGLPMTKNNSLMERPIYPAETPVRNTSIDCHSPKSLNVDGNRPLMQHASNDNVPDRTSIFNAMKMMSEMERSRECHPVGQEMRPANHEIRAATSDVRMQNQSPHNFDLRSPSREIRTSSQEHYRTQSQELRLPSQQEYNKMRGQEMRPPSREYKPTFAHDMQVIQELMPSTNMEMRQANSDSRPPSGDMRSLSEYRMQSQDPRPNYEMMQSPMHESPKTQSIDARNTSQEIRIIYFDGSSKHVAETAKQSKPDNGKHAIARKMVVGGPDFRSPSPNTGNPKPQAEFLQPSSGPAPNYVRLVEYPEFSILNR